MYMRKLYICGIAFGCICASAHGYGQSESGSPKPPVAERIPHTLHDKAGGTRTDYYYWMRNRGDKNVVDYLEAENAYTDSVMAPAKGMEDSLFREMKNRVVENAQSAPYHLGDYWYYERYVDGGDYPVYCRRKNSMSAPEEVIIDGNALREGKDFLNFDIVISPDQKLACVIMDTMGRNFFSIRILDIAKQQWLRDIIPSTRNGCEWTNDSKSIVYGVPDKKTLRVYQVRLHTLGGDAKKDKVLYEEKNETLDCYLDKSRSKKYIFIDAERTDANQYLYCSADTPGTMHMVLPLAESRYYTVEHTGGDNFLIRTDYLAPNYRLVSAPVADPSVDNWKDVIPNRDSVYLDDVEYFRDFMVAQEFRNGLTRLRIIGKDGKESEIGFDDPAYYAILGYNPEFNSDSVRYLYSSLVAPFRTIDLNMRTGGKKVVKEDRVPGYEPANYVTERLWVTARDGVRVPMTIVYNKNVYKKDGTCPGLIYGYGSYGDINEDYFDADILSLLDRGFVYANTHVRGGSEMGGYWYEDGRMLHKKNTFFDFIDCSQWLIDNGYVARDKLFANGMSAGGLLMGAVSNLAPNLYRGIIADVPFVDVITTMEDASIPLTTFEWLEWGNPAIPDQYKYMLSYSPYDNVEKKAYPNMLVTTSYNDSQVQYWEPAKWVAKLRYMKTDQHMLLLKTNMHAGHGGAYGRYEILHEYAFMYAFMLHALDLPE